MTLAGRRFARLSWVGAPANSFGIQRAFESQLGFVIRVWSAARELLYGCPTVQP